MYEEEPLVSVIVPVYNGQDYLAGCIESIEKQTYRKLEIIIVNDGSTDGTDAVCDRLQASYDNVRILRMDDEGVSAARNAGVAMATGAFFTFVDADDRVRADMIERLYDCLIRTGSDAAGCRFFQWSSEEEWQRMTAGAYRDGTEPAGVLPVRTDGRGSARTSDAAVVGAAAECAGEEKVYDAQTYLREELLCGNSRCWSKLYRRELIERVSFREGLSIGEDLLFLVQLLPHLHKIAETTAAGYGYYQNPAGAINRAFTPRYMDQITCWRLVREEVLRMDARLDAQVSALWIMGVLLTAGKLAGLPAADRRANEQYVGICWDNLREALRVPGAYGKLSFGYRCKAALFRVFPHLYLGLYHLHKR